MYERFSDRARKVMELAKQEAWRFNDEYIGTEHLLLGLSKEGAGVAARVLQAFDVDLREIRMDVEKLKFMISGPNPTQRRRLPQTPRARKVIEYAMEEARNLRHKYVGTEHILLGLLRQEECVAAQVLVNRGLKLDQVREEIVNTLGYGIDETGETLNVDSSPEISSEGFFRRLGRFFKDLLGIPG